jgi:hypothetical protein
MDLFDDKSDECDPDSCIRFDGESGSSDSGADEPDSGHMSFPRVLFSVVSGVRALDLRVVL